MWICLFTLKAHARACVCACMAASCHPYFLVYHALQLLSRCFVGSKKERLIRRPHLAVSISVTLHLVLHLLLDFHEIVRMSSLQNVVRIGLVTTMLKGLIEYLPLVSTFCTSLGEYWRGRSPLSSCDFFANWSSTTHTLLKDVYEMLPAFF